MENRIHKIYSAELILLFAIAILFLVFYLFLAFNNRFATDDLEFIQLFRREGWLGSVINSYNNHTFRWPAVLIFDLFFGANLTFLKLHYLIFLYHLVTISVFIFAVYNLITNISKLLMVSLPDKKTRFIFSVLFIASFFFVTFQIADTWFWLIASCVHLQACIFGTLALSFILKPKKRGTDHILIILFAIIAAGLSENFAIWFIIFLTFLIIYLRIKKRRHTESVIPPALLRGLTVGLIAASISFNINISGMGLKSRIKMIKEETPVVGASVKENPSLPQSFDFNNMPDIIISKKNLAFFLLSASFFFFGSINRRKHILQLNTPAKTNLIKYLKVAIPLTILSVVIALLPLFYIFKGTGPLRAWVPASLMLAVFFCLLFFIIGYENISKIIGNVFRLLLLAGFAILVAYFIRQANLVTAYSKSFDERCKFLDSLQSAGNTKTIDVKGLSDSGMLPNGDITEDENMHLNDDFRDVLQLSFKVKSSDNYFKRYSGRTIVVY